MPPTSHRDFQKAAAQRLTTAKFLLDHKYTLDAGYLAGYTIECSWKALILRKTASADQPEQLKKISSSAKMHRPEMLMGVLRDLGVKLPLKLTKRFRRMKWSTDLRYETGHRDAGEARAFLKTAKATYDGVEGQMP